jgi:hypothetical protein
MAIRSCCCTRAVPGFHFPALAPNLEALARLFHAYAPEQRAHGHTPEVHGPLSYQGWAGHGHAHRPPAGAVMRPGCQACGLDR